MMRFFILPLLVVFTASCTTIETAVESIDLDVYRQHAASISTLDRWDIRGRISVRAGSKGEIGRMLWTRNGDSHHLELYGNFGSRRIRMVQDSDSAVLEDTQGRKIIGSTIQAVLEERTEQKLPIDALTYWMTGAIYPRASSVNVWDIDGRLITIQQSGWSVHFSKYRAYGEYELPTRLNIVSLADTTLTDESDDRTVDEIRIVISEWGI